MATATMCASAASVDVGGGFAPIVPVVNPVSPVMDEIAPHQA